MARIRNVKPEFFVDSDLGKLGFASRLFFIGLWCHADKHGRLKDEPDRLEVQILPYDAISGKIKVADLLGELCPRFITRYEVNGKKYIQINGFEKHQRPHPSEPESLIPPPSENHKKREKTFLAVKKHGEAIKEPGEKSYKGDGDGEGDGREGNHPPVAPATASSKVKEVIDYFFERCVARLGVKPVIVGKRDGSVVKTSLEKYGLDASSAKSVIDWFLGSRKCEELGPSLSIALSANSINQWKLKRSRDEAAGRERLWEKEKKKYEPENDLPRRDVPNPRAAGEILRTGSDPALLSGVRRKD